MVVVKRQSIGFPRLRDLCDLVHRKLDFRKVGTSIFCHEDAGVFAGCSRESDEAEVFREEFDSLYNTAVSCKGVRIDTVPLLSGIGRLFETVEARTQCGIRHHQPVACIGSGLCEGINRTVGLIHGPAARTLCGRDDFILMLRVQRALRDVFRLHDITLRCDFRMIRHVK